MPTFSNVEPARAYHEYTEALERAQAGDRRARGIADALAWVLNGGPGPFEGGEEQVDELVANLAMLAHRLVRRIRKHDPDSKIAAQAIEFLDRKGLGVSVLRSGDADDAEPQEPTQAVLLDMVSKTLRDEHGFSTGGAALSSSNLQLLLRSGWRILPPAKDLEKPAEAVENPERPKEKISARRPVTSGPSDVERQIFAAVYVANWSQGYHKEGPGNFDKYAKDIAAERAAAAVRQFREELKITPEDQEIVNEMRNT